MTCAPMRASQRVSQAPLKPVWPVTATRRPRQASGSGSAGTGPDVRAPQPVRRLADALVDADPRLPAEQALGLLDARPAPHDVDLEGRQVLELEVLGVVAGGRPAVAGDLGDRPLVPRGD